MKQNDSNTPSSPTATTSPAPKAGDTETITGSVRMFTFRNEETGYFVAHVDASESGRRGTRDVIVVGNATSIWTGEDIEASGRWVNNPQYGLQFKADTIKTVEPTSPKGIERYLVANIRNVGPALAKRIVDHFGVETLSILERQSARLREIPGIGPKKIHDIKASWESKREFRAEAIFLQGQGITSGTAQKIIRKYGTDTIAIVRSNPYRLCADIDGIGFLKADEIARKTGVPEDSPLRARAGIYYTLEKLSEEGHCFCEKPELLIHANQMLNIPVDVLETALADELEGSRLVNDGGRIYLARLFRAESCVAQRVRIISDAHSALPPIQVDRAVAWVDAKLPFHLSPEQADAVRMALGNKFTVITGGPGVGKTTIIRALCEIWSAKGCELALVAPTGRASRRMSESTGFDARTIHRLLKWNPQVSRFVYSRENPLSQDVFIIDESSMIDVELANSLLGAIPNEATVVMVGDIDQLPSVGPGNVLRDIIDSREVPVARLTQIFRQKTGGWIVRNAHHVNEGEAFETPPAGEVSDFFFVKSEIPEQTLPMVLELVARRIPRRYNLDPLHDVQVLSPGHPNSLGTDNLNLRLQEELNPHGAAVERFGVKFRMGDRVMQVRNNYDKDVFNGDIGFITQVSADTKSVAVDFDGTLVNYAGADLAELVHAYATTIHKSQGSEYKAVVLVISKQHYMMLQRNLLYTGITRGKKLVCVIGSEWAVKKAIANNTIIARNTALAERIRLPQGLPALAPMVPEDK